MNWLAKIGVDAKEAIIRNKISRGKYTATSTLWCLIAIGSYTLSL